MNTLKLIFTIIIFLSLHTFSIGQTEVYRVKQTQMTKDFKNYVPMDNNLIFDKLKLEKMK